MVSKLGKAVLIIKTSLAGTKTSPQSFRGHQKRAKDDPRTFPRPLSAARSKQTKPKRVPRATKMLRDQTVPKILEALGPLGSPHETPRRAPRAPKMRPREPQNASKTIFGSKMMICQKSSSRFHKINIFEGGRVSLGAQNPPQEAPGGDKKRHRKKEEKTKKEHQKRQG